MFLVSDSSSSLSLSLSVLFSVLYAAQSAGTPKPKKAPFAMSLAISGTAAQSYVATGVSACERETDRERGREEIVS